MKAFNWLGLRCCQQRISLRSSDKVQPFVIDAYNPTYIYVHFLTVCDTGGLCHSVHTLLVRIQLPMPGEAVCVSMCVYMYVLAPYLIFFSLGCSRKTDEQADRLTEAQTWNQTCQGGRRGR